MRHHNGGILFAILLCAPAPALATTSGQICDERVSLAQLIAKPDAYQGKALRVVANVTIAFENMSACPSENERHETSCLWLTIDDGDHTTDQDFARYQSKLQTWKRFDRQTVVIHATFNKTLTGHFGMWPGGLEKITEVSGRGGDWSFGKNAAAPHVSCAGDVPMSRHAH